MREIKFRAWDKKNLWIIPWNELKHINYTEQFSTFEDENFVFQQFTGLLDKNGKEIYEGDYVHRKTYHSEDDSWNEGDYEVIWKDAAFELRTPQNKFGMLIGGEEKYLEVIGNVHEHPHLLTNKE